MHIFDARVHIFPPMVSRFIWKSFEKEAWPVKYQFETEQLVTYLTQNNVRRLLGICYTNMEGMASFLNDYMAKLRDKYPSIIVPLGTVMPNEEGALKELSRIFFKLNFAGVKLHCHLLGLSPNDKTLAPIFESVAENNKVMNIHSCTVSKNAKNINMVRSFCNVDEFHKAMQRTPNVKVIVPHIGYDEVQPYLDLLDEFPNLYFDTAMAIGGYRTAVGEILPDARPLYYSRYIKGQYPQLPKQWKAALEQLIPQVLAKPDRFLFGSDFPHIPYKWNFEIEQLERYLPETVLNKLLWENAENLFLSYTREHGVLNHSIVSEMR